MVITLDVINIFILMVTIINLAIGILISRRQTEHSTNRIFVLSILGISVWNLSMVLFRSAIDPQLATIFARILYASAASIPFTFIFFVTIFPQRNYKFKRYNLVILFVLYIATLIISLHPSLLIKEIITGVNEPIIIFRQYLYVIYTGYVFGFFMVGYLILIWKWKRSFGIKKKQLFYVFIAIFSASGTALVTNLALPYLQIFDFNWVGQIATLFMVVLIAYAILKHQLFAIKVITTEVILILLAGILFIKILFSSSTIETIFNTLIFLLVLLFSFLILRGVIQEVQIRRTIETLIKQLQTANARFIELDEQKSEFISIASHQLRTPLTAIKGYASLLLEGSFGKLPKKSIEPITTIFNSSQRLVKTVNNFLTLSRIEKGSMQYQFEILNLKDLIIKILDEIKPTIEEKGLTIKFNYERNQLYSIDADYIKIYHAISNLLDNSIQHTEKGLIDVSLYFTINDNIRLTISDTGEGARTDDVEKLFDKLSANISTSKQSSFDLYVAREIIDAHGGAIRAESQGLGHGITFFVEFNPSGKKMYD